MQFEELKRIIKEKAQTEPFQIASENIQTIILNLPRAEFIPLIVEFGVIPEDIEHDSTEEKLYSKVSDIVLAKCFIELGFKAIIYKERANCADILVKSNYHNYSLVGDAKSFRLSRTAKNQKDFKVESMVHWKCDNDYSVLCCPYFQYPKNKSQIYGQAINGNITLFSWEYFNILLSNNIKESQSLNLSQLWNFSHSLSTVTSVNNMNQCFLDNQNKFIMQLLKINEKIFERNFKVFRNSIVNRGNSEIQYWQEQIKKIKELSHSDAINLLIKSLKLNEKINSINTYINQVGYDDEN